MFAIMESSTASGASSGFFASFPKRYVKKGKKEIKGRRFLHLVVELPEKNIGLQGKRIRRAAIMLRDEGIRTVVTAEDFPFTKQLWDLGISTVSSYYAYLACASKIANAAAKQMGIPFENSTGVIFANEVTKDVADLAAMLITITKYVKLDCGLGKERLQKKLSMEYGVCPLQKTLGREFLICFSAPSEQYLQSSKAEIIVDLSGSNCQKKDSVLFTGAELGLPDEVLKQECIGSGAQMISLLLLMEVIKPSDIIVTRAI